mmetsp:Transcript_129670/g.415940  ORF Transcript_129670/g.415940 Transcript_129670/m.415940 type:complete len:311 (+) Transcript_129670:258-1190(+)
MAKFCWAAQASSAWRLRGWACWNSIFIWAPSWKENRALRPEACACGTTPAAGRVGTAVLRSFLRRFFSSGPHTWQNLHAAPLRQPPLMTKAQGLQSPWPCPMDPTLGEGGGDSGASGASIGASPGGAKSGRRSAMPGGGTGARRAAAIVVGATSRRASSRRSTPASRRGANAAGDASARPRHSAREIASEPCRMPEPAGVGEGVGSGVEASEVSAVLHTDSASRSSSSCSSSFTVGRRPPLGVVVWRRRGGVETRRSADGEAGAAADDAASEGCSPGSSQSCARSAEISRAPARAMDIEEAMSERLLTCD